MDAHTVETVRWHFSEATGCPFWLQERKELSFDPLKEVRGFDDLRKFPLFEDDWLRGGPVRRWVSKGLEGKPTYVFETGGTTGVPKSRVVIEDHWIDYELFSETLPDKRLANHKRALELGAAVLDLLVPARNSPDHAIPSVAPPPKHLVLLNWLRKRFASQDHQ